MKYVRFRDQEGIRYGILEHNNIKVLDRSFLEQGSSLTGLTVPLDAVTLLAPVEPSKVVCVGLNYSKHAQEMQHDLPQDPVIFIKPNTSVLDPGGEIVFPKMSQQVDYEAELAVIIAHPLKNANEKEAVNGIFGYTCANDVTARDLQKKDGQWTRAKSFDTFCPIGPWVETEIDPSSLNIELRLNQEVKQSSNTQYFMTSVPKLISYISQIMTLNPGDVVLTGTPEGVGPMQPEDEVVVSIQGIGELRNRVKAGL